MCPRSIAGVPFRARRFRAPLFKLLYPTCVRSYGNWRATCVVTKKKRAQGEIFRFHINKLANKQTHRGGRAFWRPKIRYDNARNALWQHSREGMETEQKRGKTKKSSCALTLKIPQPRVGWPKRLGLVWAPPWADFAVIGDQLWLTTSMTAIFWCVALSW